MATLDQVVQALAADVRIDLRGTDVGVTQHLLYCSQVRTSLQQMGGERMSEHVGREFLNHSRPATVVSNPIPD